MNKAEADIEALAGKVRTGERRALARAITLIESGRADHREQANRLITALLPDTGDSVRLGITGVPGVGKSTFIEAFGAHVTGRNHQIAVLAIDPTSKRSGGSILADKTRMEALSRNPNAFIRPSPAGRTLGGVARRTREAMLLCEAAGFDVIVVETVGVGQSETAVAEMVDMFLLLLVPGGGDELQGLKKGIVEMADLLVVNKADGDLKTAAGRAAAEYHHALQMLTPAATFWQPKVLQCSALRNEGIEAVWDAVAAFRAAAREAGAWKAHRQEQAKSWLWNELSDGLLMRFRDDPRIKARLPELERKVTEGAIAPVQAADELLREFLGGVPET